MIKEALIKGFVEEEYQDELLEKARLQKEEKSAEKAEKVAQKQQKKAEKSAKRSHFFDGLKEKFIRKEDEEVNEGYDVFFDEEGESYTAKILDASNILDFGMKTISNLKGLDLLKRDIEKSPLYVGDEKNILGVTSIKRVYSEDKEKKDSAYVLIETDYEWFVVEFKKVETF